MREFHDLILSDWDVNLLDIIYAHESDPTDVFATIERIHSGRETALKSFGGTDLPPDFSTMSNLVESVFRAGDGSEKAFYRRADSRLPQAGGGR
ncbi:TPA: hypothetical protein ACSPKV_004561, partial [Pseudomonas aeruginosa]